MAADGGERPTCSDGTGKPDKGTPGDGDAGPGDGDAGPGDGDEAPVARFGWEPEFPVADEPAFFYANESTPVGGIVRYEWIFPPNARVLGESTDWTLAAGGRTVRLIVTNAAGVADTLAQTVRVTTRPVARFTISPEGPEIGQEVTFDASTSTDSDGEVVAWEWDFGDGTTASGDVVTKAYGAAGRYFVKLTVRDNHAAEHILTKEVTVADGTLMSSGIVTSGLVAAWDPADVSLGDQILRDVSGNERHCVLGSTDGYDGERDATRSEGGLFFPSGTNGLARAGVTCRYTGIDLSTATLVSVARSRGAPTNSNGGYLLSWHGSVRVRFSSGRLYVMGVPSADANAAGVNTGDWMGIAIGLTPNALPVVNVNGTNRTVTGGVWPAELATSQYDHFILGNIQSTGGGINSSSIGGLGPTLVYDRVLSEEEMQQNYQAIRNYGQTKGFGYQTLP